MKAIAFLLVLLAGASTGQDPIPVYMPIMTGHVSMGDAVYIDVETIGAPQDTFLYAIDFVYYPGGLVFAWWNDLVNGCWLDGSGTCTIVVDERIFPNGRDGWVFVTSTNLEMLREMYFAGNLLLYTGDYSYSATVDFTTSLVSFPTPTAPTPAQTPLPTKTPAPLPTPAPIPCDPHDPNCG